MAKRFRIIIPNDDMQIDESNPLVAGDNWRQSLDIDAGTGLALLEHAEEDPHQDSISMARKFAWAVGSGVYPSPDVLKWLAVALNDYLESEGLKNPSGELEKLLGFRPARAGKRSAQKLREIFDRNADMALALVELTEEDEMTKEKAISKVSSDFAVCEDTVKRVYTRRHEILEMFVTYAGISPHDVIDK